MSKKIVVFGGIPEPIGGVTTFLSRLIERQPECFSKIYDLYPNPRKAKSHITHIQLHHKHFDLLKTCIKLDNECIFFNFSSSKSLLALALIPKRKNRWGIVLHNGLLEQKSSGRIMRCAMRFALKKMDAIGIISANQAYFYSTLYAKAEAQVNITTYVPKNRPSHETITKFAKPEILSWFNAGLGIFIASGYPTGIYQHLKIIQTFKNVVATGNKNIRLALFLYGKNDDGILDEIKREAMKCSQIVVYWNTCEDVFSASLALSSGYIRMNTVDSYGIAVADAVSYAIPTIASNVCQRYPGALIVEPTDFASLHNFITNPHQAARQTASECNDNINAFLDLLRANPVQK